MNSPHISDVARELLKRFERRRPGYLMRSIFKLFGVRGEQMQAEQARTGQSFAEILGIRPEDLRRNRLVRR